jgi:signal transduction histidine kinase
MVNEILQFARGEQRIIRSKVNMTEWLDDVVELMHRDFEESRVTFNKSLKYDGEIYVDYEKFKSVFFNIAANALTAMPEGGTFTFKSSQKAKQVRLDFIDTGVGMGDEAKAHVFEEFFSQAKDGTGLGMAIVKRIVEAHEGTISLESELGKGTKFSILLPTDRE